MNSVKDDTFEEYILHNREGIKKLYLTKEYKNNTLRGKTETKTKVDTSLIKKWMPVINNGFSGIELPEFFKDNLCLYCELIVKYRERPLNPMSYRSTSPQEISDNISSELASIREKILHSGNRSKIIDKYYNYSTGKAEYLLEDGTYVPIDERLLSPTVKVDMSVLPIELLSIVDEKEYRSEKINQLL
jgi:hypothetical protein